MRLFVASALLIAVITCSGFSQSADEAEARYVIERFEAALIAGDISKLDSLMERGSLDTDSDFFRQRTPGGARVISSTVTASGMDDGFYFVDVYRELVDGSGRKVTLFGHNNVRVFARRQNGVMRVKGRRHRDYWFGDHLVSTENSADRLTMIKANPAIDYREAIIRVIYRFRITGDLENSNRALEICRSVAADTSDTAFLARCELNQGLLHIHQGRYRQALGSFLESERLSLKVGDRHGYARAMNAIADLYNSQGNHLMALTLNEKALAEIKNANINELEAHVTLNGIYLGLAHSMIATRELPRASRYLELASNLGIQTYGIPDYPVRFMLAKVDLMQGNTESAYHSFRQLEEYARRRDPNDIEILVQCLNEIATIRLSSYYDAEGSERLARESANRASAADLAFHETRSLTIIGNSLVAQKRNTEAEEAFLRAVELLENRRSMTAGDQTSLTSFFVNRLEPYEKLVDLLIADGRIYDAFQFSERSKARALADLLAHSSDAGDSLTSDSTSRLRETLANRNLALILERQRPMPDRIKLAMLENEVETARRALEDERTRIIGSRPKADLQFSTFKAVDRTGLEKLLANDRTAVVEYAISDARSYSFVITRKQGKVNISAYSLYISRTSLSKKVDAFRQKLQSADLGYKPAAKDLYHLLVRDWVSELKGIDSIIVVPDGVVWDVPFQALLSDSNRFLIEDHSIGYAPSLTVLSQMKDLIQEKPFATGSLLAFGNPRIGDRTQAAEKLRGGRLEPLPSAEREVDALGRLFRSRDRDIVKGLQASESLFRRTGHRYDLLHFATHGLLNSKNPMYSALLLSVSPNSTDDGLVEAWELMEMKLDASLAVLSACETARGHNPGEGIVGLSWAFFVAGVPRVVASQWKVESRSTADLMTVFYKNLRTEHSVQKALQKAMIDQLSKGKQKHPFYWAGFIAVGG